MSKEVRCGICGTIAKAKFKWTFLGLRQYHCPGCKTVHQFGLSLFAKGLYAFFTLLLCYAIFIGVAQPGFLLLIVAYAFYKDYMVHSGIMKASLISHK